MSYSLLVPKRIAAAAAFFALGAGFLALAAWCLVHGVSAGAYAAASRAESPALFWLFIAGDAWLAFVMLGGGLKALGIDLPMGLAPVSGLAALLALGLWALIELAARLIPSVLAEPDLFARALLLVFAALGLGVFAYLLKSLVWETLKEEWLERRRRGPR